MNFKEIFSNAISNNIVEMYIRTISDNNYYNVETIILYLLKYLAEKENKNLIIHYKEKINNYHMEFDGLLPKGINEIYEPTLVEIKMRVNANYVNKLLNITTHLFPKYTSLLLIVASELKENDYKLIEKVKSTLPEKFNLTIWDQKKIIDLIQAYQDFSKPLYDFNEKNMLNFAIRTSNRKERDWEKDKEFYIGEINQFYNQDRLVFFLGAGVSLDAGIPSWPLLINRLNISLIEKQFSNSIQLDNEDKKALVELLNSNNNSTPLISARYLKAGLGESFISEVKKALYENIKPMEQHRILSTIAKCSHSARGRLGLKSIITYNFDDLLEKLLEKEIIKARSIYREGDIPLDNELPIYHVHGFIPQETEKYSDLDKSLLVFSEEGYHALQSDFYSWSNLVQINALRENVAVLIGLSVTDPNLRRLLSIFAQRNNDCKHFVLLKRPFKENKINIAQDTFDEFSKINHSIQDEILKSFGLNVIWFEEYSQLPNLIGKMTESSS